MKPKKVVRLLSERSEMIRILIRAQVSHQSSRELEERGKAMDFANSFLQFVKEQRLSAGCFPSCASAEQPIGPRGGRRQVAFGYRNSYH